MLKASCARKRVAPYGTRDGNRFLNRLYPCRMVPPPLAETSMTSFVLPTATAAAMKSVAVAWKEASAVPRPTKLGTERTAMEE